MATTQISSLPVRVDYYAWKGDTWNPGTITATISSTPVDFTGWSAKAEFRRASDGVLAQTINSPSSGITLTSLGVITMTMTAAQTNALSEGVYRYDLQMTNPSGIIKTYTFGTFTLNGDSTAN